jgi:hypothetical protein
MTENTSDFDRQGDYSYTQSENGPDIVSFIVHHMTGEPLSLHQLRADSRQHVQIPFPRDAQDLGYVMRLLEARPEWRPRLAEMQEYSLRWKAIAQEWGMLDHVYAEGDSAQTTRALQNVMNEAIFASYPNSITKSLVARIFSKDSAAQITRMPKQGGVEFANAIAEELHDAQRSEDFNGSYAVWIRVPKYGYSALVAQSSEFGNPYFCGLLPEDLPGEASEKVELCIQFNHSGPELPGLPLGKGR